MELLPVTERDEKEPHTKLGDSKVCGIQNSPAGPVIRSFLAIDITNPIDQKLKTLLFAGVAYAVNVLEQECSRPQVLYNPKILVERVCSWVF
jgi:hypothetical protein